MSENEQLRLVLSTCPPDHAQGLAEALVGDGLAACVNIIPGLRSVYRWEGELHCDGESLLLIKTAADRLESVQTRLLGLHPYELPEIVVVPIVGGLDAYLAWVAASVVGPAPSLAQADGSG
ncbi:MAG: divalent-cation tolerance protein CutA [Xanthomonadales bacterium]|nr:divalent-cation tolerance protein CutA [Xanthomonadales bacterium]